MSKVAKSVAFLVNTSATEGTYSWLRIKKSTLFTISYNPELADYDYIADETKTSEVDSYAPTIEQDIGILPDEEDYEFFNTFRKGRFTGTDAHKTFAVVYINDGTAEAGFYTEVQEAVLSVTDYNAVDGKINVAIGFCGSVVKGTTMVADGAYTFTPAA